jgi:hypothetical protein
VGFLSWQRLISKGDELELRRIRVATKGFGIGSVQGVGAMDLDPE